MATDKFKIIYVVHMVFLVDSNRHITACQPDLARCPIWKIKFLLEHRHTHAAPLPSCYNSRVGTETIRPMKPEIFTIWPFTKRLPTLAARWTPLRNLSLSPDCTVTGVACGL